MEHLIESAERLGRDIAAHERTKLLLAAQREVNVDEEARAIVKAYQEQAMKIRKLEMEQKPIEVADKQKLREIEEKISTNEKLKELTRRQVDFVDMMQKVKKGIDDQLQIEGLGGTGNVNP